MRAGGDHEEIFVLEAIRTANAHRQELSEFLIDNSVLIISTATSRRELTVREISIITTIPLATCYKLVERMASLGLLAETGKVRTSSRGKASMYVSTLKGYTVEVSNGLVEMVVTWKNGQTMAVSREVCAAIPNEVMTPIEEDVTLLTK